jgi:endonuclease YncB( thermonuclease family)
MGCDFARREPFRPMVAARAAGIVALVLFLFGSHLTSARAREPWVTFQNCRYLVKRANDGDSFHVSVNGKEYIFRLYYVDAPETDTEFRDRVEEQARYFGITVDQAVEVGQLAKTFTRERLSHPFVVRTCLANAMGRSRLPRFYALVQTDTGDLGEQLVENGLARIHGEGARPVGLPSAASERAKLKRLELNARLEKVGAWGAKVGRMTARAQKPESAKGVDPFDVFFHPEKVAAGSVASASTRSPHGQALASPPAQVGNQPVPTNPASAVTPEDQSKLDVNTASSAELENIPGIGPVLAQRIIAARPFKSADDLQNVKGIGAGKKYQQIRSNFR